MKTFLSCLALVSTALASDPPKENPPGDLVPLILRLPQPVGCSFERKPMTDPLIEYLSDVPRSPMMVPRGLTNLAPASTVTCSDTNATAQTLAKLTDGDKDSGDAGIIYLPKGIQWVQLDFGAPHELYAIVIWFAHDPPQVVHHVVIQLSDDPEFNVGVRTLFNNDRDNSSGRGVGTDREFFETYEGRLVDAKGIKARYLRCYSKGTSESHLNKYTEVEVYGRPRISENSGT